MAPTAHSSFSASSAARLLACPGSYALGLKMDDGTRRSTVYSAEGTLAHAVGEACLLTHKDAADFIGETRTADGFQFTIDEEFAEHTQVYVDYIRSLRALGYVVMLEQRVDPSVQWRDDPNLPDLPVDLFGTADCTAYHPGTKHLVIGDLKFGAGVPVDVKGNAQLQYYGSGAAHEDVLKPLCESAGVPFNGVDEVTLTIIQPRAFHRDGPVRRDVISYADLRTWARDTLYPGVKRALDDEGKTLDAGSWCRFCPVIAHCEKPRELSFETARKAFKDTPIENIPAPTDQGAALPDAQLTDDELADILDKIQIIEPWLKAAKELGQNRMEAARSVKGWKLVPKRALRRWAGDEHEMLGALQAAGLPDDKITTSKLKSPAQVEKALGKRDYEAHVAPHVVRTSSGTTLACEGDPRARIVKRSAQQAFNPTK